MDNLLEVGEGDPRGEEELEGRVAMPGGVGKEAFKDGLLLKGGVEALDIEGDGRGLPGGLGDTAGELGGGCGLGGEVRGVFRDGQGLSEGGIVVGS